MDTKYCNKCNIIKCKSEFYTQKKKSGQIIYRSYCKPCFKSYMLSTYEGRRERHNFLCREYASDPAKKTYYRGKMLESKYGIGGESYDAILSRQEGLCAICKKPERERGVKILQKRLSVDHSHKTGKIRGLLCAKCNRGLGSFEDDPSVLLSAINYLNEQNK